MPSICLKIYNVQEETLSVSCSSSEVRFSMLQGNITPLVHFKVTKVHSTSLEVGGETPAMTMSSHPLKLVAKPRLLGLLGPT